MLSLPGEQFKSLQMVARRCLFFSLGVVAFPGKHDRWLGGSELAKGIRQVGGFWLPDQPIFLRDGLELASVESAALFPKGDSSILWCIHDPKEIDRLPSGPGTALAGHLHGCQVVFGEGNRGWFPGCWFYRWNGPRFHHRGKEIFVSRGLADTLPFRWNCPREVLVIEIG